MGVKSLQPSKGSGPGSEPLEKSKPSAPESTRRVPQGIEGAALPSEGRWPWKGPETRRVVRRTLRCPYPHRACRGYPTKLLQKPPAVTLG